MGLSLALAAELPAQGTAWSRDPLAPTAAQHDPQAIWGNVRSTWTSTDVSRGTPAPSQSSQPQSSQPADPPAAPPSPPGLWQTATTAPARLPLPAGPAMTSLPSPASGNPPVPAPEAVIRSALQPLLPPPPTATAVLRGNVPPRPATAAGIARTLSPPVTVSQVRPAVSGLGPAPDVPLEPQTPAALAPDDWQALPPEPADVTMRHALHQEERASPLFDIPTDAGVRINRQSAERIESLFETSPRPLLPHTALPQREAPLVLRDAPPASPDAPPPSDGAVGRATANLDGLDAVPKSTAPDRTPYEPAPLSQIRPTHDYSPEGILICPHPEGRCPPEHGLPVSSQLAERSFPQIDFLWVPTNVFYGPLYFEDPALERYGHSHGPLLQSLASPSRFALQFVSLPYQMALDPPHRRVYPLGFYRPGDYAPKQVPNVPLNAEAAAVAGAVYTGLIFAFP